MPAVALLYLGLCLVVAGIMVLFTRWRRRWPVLIVGVVLVAIALLLPARNEGIPQPRSHLDGFVPVWQFDEVHRIRTGASCADAWAAIKSVTAGEIRLFRTLTWIRRMGKPGPESILNAPEHAPILEVATRTGFRLLAEEVEREVVLGVELPPAGATKAFMNFRLTELGPSGCEVTTETRVNATTQASRRQFARYWRVIYPGSALIRRMWLAAIRERAERLH